MYPGTTKASPVAVEGSSSTAPVSTGALCAGNTTIDWVPQHETDAVPTSVAALCARCPLRVECLKWATDFDAEGYWGGTTTAQRRGKIRPDRIPQHEGPGSAGYYRRGCACGTCSFCVARPEGAERKGCRCDECREAQTARMRARRALAKGRIR